MCILPEIEKKIIFIHRVKLIYKMLLTLGSGQVSANFGGRSDPLSKSGKITLSFFTNSQNGSDGRVYGRYRYSPPIQ